jgi:hypothetical protein
MRKAPLIFGAALLFVASVGAQSIPLARRQDSPVPSMVERPKDNHDPADNVLTLPRASRAFVGNWGGHLYAMSAMGLGGEAGPFPTGLAFGQRDDGTVFLETNVWSATNSTLLRASAVVSTRTRVKIHEEHLHSSSEGNIRLVEDFDLILKPAYKMDCLEMVKAYGESGANVVHDGRPIFSVSFHGVLGIITQDQQAELREELLRQGHLPQAEVRGSRNFESGTPAP